MIERAVLEYVANSVWQVPLLAGIAWLAIRWGKPEPRVQYRMWIGTLALAVVLPLIRPACLHVYISRTAQDQFAAPARGISIVPSIGEEQALHRDNITRTEIGSEQTGDTGGVSYRVKSKSATFPHSIQLSGIVWSWLLGIYFAILLLRLAYLARSRRAAGKLLRNARKSALSPLELTVLERCCEKLGVTAPRLMFSRKARTPMAIGSNRPAVLLPESFHACTEAEMKAILCHELAHVRRGDYLANWIFQLGSLPIAYHPATYGIDCEIRRSRELTCDAMAAAAMDSSVEYAGCLVGLARRIEGESVESRTAGPGSAAASGLFDHDVFEERIMSLLERRSGRVRTSVWRMTGAFALIAGAAVCAAALHITPVVRAAEASATVQQAATSAPAQTTSQTRAPVKKPARVQVHAVIPLEMRMSVKAVAPVQNAIPVVAKIRVRVVVPIAELAEPLRAVVPLQDVTPVKPAPPLPPNGPKAEPMPPALTGPATSASPAAPQQLAPTMPPSSVPDHRESVDSGVTFHLTPAQRAQIDREMAAARAQIREQTKAFNSLQFQAQMAQMHRQIEAATKNLRSAEFQAQMKALQSPEFKKQMADMRVQMQEATKQMRSAEFQAQMKALQSSEFKKQMADMQRQIQQATKQMRSAGFQQQMKYLQSPEFKKQMEDMQRQMREATKNLQMNRMQLDMKQMPKRETPAAPSEKDNPLPQ